MGSTFDSLGLSDKVQLVKKVAQTVQVIITCSYEGWGGAHFGNLFVEFLQRCGRFF